MHSNRLKIAVALLAVTLLTVAAFGQSVVRTTAPGHRGWGLSNLLGTFGDYLELTDEQRTQMKAILAKEKPNFQPLVKQLAAGNQQMRQIEEASSFDEAKVRTLANQQSQAMTELMVQKARVKSELLQVLTPDQKTKMAAFEARRQARFQRHFNGSTDSSEAVPNQ
jgi:Spy/CpxP family protein refolding chaperone